MDDINIKNIDGKEKTARAKWGVIVAVIVAAAISLLCLAFGFAYISGLITTKNDVIELVDQVILPDDINNNTWKDTLTIFQKMLTGESDKWGEDFVKKVANKTTEENSYHIHRFMYIEIPVEWQEEDFRVRVDSYLDVNNNVAHGTLEFSPVFYDDILKALGEREGHFNEDYAFYQELGDSFDKNYEIYQELQDDGRIFTYIKNDEKWYVYHSSDNDHKSVALTPKGAMEIYASDQIRTQEHAVKRDDTKAVTIYTDSIPPIEMHQVIKSSSEDDTMVFISNSDDTFRGIATLDLSMDIKRLSEIYNGPVKNLLSLLAEKKPVIRIPYGMEYDKYGQINDVQIPQNVIDDAIEVDSFDFINDYIFSDLDFPYTMDSQGNLVNMEETHK